MEVARSGLWAPAGVQNARRRMPSMQGLTLHGATYFLSIRPADLECFKNVSTIYHRLFGLFSGNINGL